MQTLTTTQEVDAALARPTAIVYKHSTRCPISAAARGQMENFERRHPDAPLFMVDVIASRDLSRYVENQTGVEHHSPQLILLRDGSPAWDASHFDITADALERELAGAGG